jgi:transposase-like protein
MKTLDNLRDVFKGLKHSKPTAKYCPRCGSPKLRLSSSLDYWLTPQKYLCSNCGYAGSIFMELEKEEEK